jgi:hypothetical protein
VGPAAEVRGVERKGLLRPGAVGRPGAVLLHALVDARKAQVDLAALETGGTGAGAETLAPAHPVTAQAALALLVRLA